MTINHTPDPGPVDFAAVGFAVEQIVEIAHAVGIAIHWIHPTYFQDVAGRPLTQAEWERLKPEFDDFDEYMDDRLFDEHSEFAFRCLKAAGIEVEL